MKTGDPKIDDRMWGTLGTQGLDERPLCPHCMRPIRPYATFCRRCMAPVSSYASFAFLGHGNYEGIWSSAWILGRALRTHRPRLMHVIVVSLTFLPGMIGAVLFVAAEAGPPSGYALGVDLLGLFTLGVMFCISAAFVWQVWANYVRGPAPVEPWPAEDEEDDEASPSPDDS